MEQDAVKTEATSSTGTVPEAEQAEKTEAVEKQTFTKEEVERLIQERLARVQKKYADYEALKAKARKAEEYEAAEAKRREAEMSEVQRWQTKAQEYEARLAALEAEMQAERLRFHVEREAAVLGFIKPEHAYRLADFSGVSFDEGGQPNVEAIRAALSALAKDSPHLLQAKQPPAANIGATEGRGPANEAVSLEEKRKEWRRRFRY